MPEEEFYKNVARIYDRMIRWENRLANEKPLFEAIWQRSGAKRILDAACGSGRHLPLYVEQGLEVVASDASGEMLALAERIAAGIPEKKRPALIHSPWKDLPEKVPGTFDAVLCLGNSLPYVTDRNELKASLEGLWSKVSEEAFLLIQFKNFMGLRKKEERFLPLSFAAATDEDPETVCVRQYNWHEGWVEFLVIALQKTERPDKKSAGPWSMTNWSTPLATYSAEDVRDALESLGAKVEGFGSLKLDPYNPETSPDVVLWAENRKNGD